MSNFLIDKVVSFFGVSFLGAIEIIRKAIEKNKLSELLDIVSY